MDISMKQLFGTVKQCTSIRALQQCSTEVSSFELYTIAAQEYFLISEVRKVSNLTLCSFDPCLTNADKLLTKGHVVFLDTRKHRKKFIISFLYNLLISLSLSGHNVFLFLLSAVFIQDFIYQFRAWEIFCSVFTFFSSILHLDCNLGITLPHEDYPVFWAMHRDQNAEQ